MILVDDRAGSAELEGLLASPSMLCHLDYGDFAWCGNGRAGAVEIGVERKSLLDFLQSMVTGRLSGHQLIGMLDHYDVSYVVLEGVWRPDRHTGILHRATDKGWKPVAFGQRQFMVRDIYNFINTIQVICGVVVVATANKWETARWVDSIYGWWDKEWDRHKSHLQWNKPTGKARLAKPNLVTRMASQLDGVGWDKAWKIGAKFPTIWHFLSAGLDEFMEIDGIGPGIARSIGDQLEGSEEDQ